VQTDRTILNNKPDITVRDNEKGTCMLINVANFRRYECDIERNRKHLKDLKSFLNLKH